MTDESSDVVEMTMSEFKDRTGIKPRDLAACLGLIRQNINHHLSSKSISVVKYNTVTGEISFYTPEKTLANGVLSPDKIDLSKLGGG